MMLLALASGGATIRKKLMRRSGDFRGIGEPPVSDTEKHVIGQSGY
jgi:hypothetical protein